MANFETAMKLNPVETYHKVFRQGAIPFMTKLSMLNQAPLAALGIGPKSWRAAQLAQERTVLSNAAKKSIARMVVG